MNIILIALLSFPSFADIGFVYDKKVKSCPKDVKEIGQEFLLVEEKGARVQAGKVSCIKNTTLKYVKAWRSDDAAEKGAPKITPVVIKKDSFKIENIKELSKELLEYQVEFSAVNAKTGKTVKDSFKFMASNLAKGNRRPKFGCAFMSDYPSEIYISEDCI